MAINNIVLLLSFSFLIVAFILAFVRLLLGQGIYNRIAAMDLIASIVIGFVLVYAVFIQMGLYIDVAVIISLVAFLGTVAVSIYLKNNTNKNDGDNH